MLTIVIIFSSGRMVVTVAVIKNDVGGAGEVGAGGSSIQSIIDWEKIRPIFGWK